MTVIRCLRQLHRTAGQTPAAAMRIASAGEMVTGQGPVRYQVQIAST